MALLPFRVQDQIDKPMVLNLVAAGSSMACAIDAVVASEQPWIC
jgi:hypothetical protein